jgi:hypothetical protein
MTMLLQAVVFGERLQLKVGVTEEPIHPVCCCLAVWLLWTRQAPQQ